MSEIEISKVLAFSSVIHACFDIRDFGPLYWRLYSVPGLCWKSQVSLSLPPPNFRFFHSPSVRSK